MNLAMGRFPVGKPEMSKGQTDRNIHNVRSDVLTAALMKC